MGQSPIGQSAPLHSANRRGDKVHGVFLGGIQAEGEFIGVPMPMLRAHVVVETVVPAFQQGPKRSMPLYAPSRARTPWPCG